MCRIKGGSKVWLLLSLPQGSHLSSLIPSPQLHLFLSFSEQSILNVSRVWFWLIFFLASFTANFNVNFWVAWNSYWASSLGFLGPNTTAGTHPNEFVIWWLHCPHRISEGVCVSSSPHLPSSICYSSLPTLSSSTRFCLVSLKNYIHGNISSPFFCLRWLPISSLVTSHTFVWEICREFQINSISRGRKGP